MSFTITQNLFRDDATTITVVKCLDDAVGVEHLQPLLETALAHRVLGISATYEKTCKLSLIAFATLSCVLVVNISRHARHAPQDARQRRIARSRSLLQDRLLLHRGFHKYAFMMDQLAVSLYLDMSIRISHAVDMISVTDDGRHSLQALMNAMGGELELEKENVQSLFFETSGSMKDATASVALKAWVACKAASLSHMYSRFASLPRIDTKTIPKARLIALTNISRHADRLDGLSPLSVKNDIKSQFTMKKDVINLQCERYSTRIQRSKHQVIQIEIEGNDTKTRVTGKVHGVIGRCAGININQQVEGDKIVSVTTIGKSDPTFADSARQDVVLKTLQHETEIFSNPFFRALWLPNERSEWPKIPGRNARLPVHFSRDLNPSQQAAVQSILSDKDDHRIVMIQGPPGTGKTTVIAASVISHDNARSSRKIWVAAQSNVAVKNIAEKFIKEGFSKFKLLVSKDFHFDWHEHLYEGLNSCLIRSDMFILMSVADARRMLGDSRVILCTLSMFSNPNIDAFLAVVQVEMIILDEASQIECGNYLPIFHRFHSTLLKLVFIGDDKQLPPYGQEDIPELRSIFEFPHLRRRALFLDTQYRMPHVIGNFISRNVYDGKLSTHHALTTPKACRFIDVNKSRELKRGHSWTNPEEVRVVVKLVRAYKSTSFRIITPYDAQRALIEKSLKSEKLPWENKVFNVDSFQGNEDDHIIISVVRSQGPGFLKNNRRTNVMLTRCKQSMVICSSRAFLFGNASNTLVGKLAAIVDADNWVSGRDVLQGLWRI